jgi:hypothetical protein
MSSRTFFLRGIIVFAVPGFIIGFLLAPIVIDPYGKNLGEAKEEQDMNGDGRVDAIVTYSDGLISRAKYDTNFDGAFDLWHFYSDGLLVSGEADILPALMISEFRRFESSL